MESETYVGREIDIARITVYSRSLLAYARVLVTNSDIVRSRGRFVITGSLR